MATGHSQFVGTAGQFYLAYGLSIRNINASITIGNAPSVDVIASSSDGRYSLSIQVKTSRNAYRNNRYGHAGYEWDVGASAIEKHRESFWYALIDLQENNNNWNPKVFFVPSKWIADFVKPDFSRKLYYLSSKTNDLKAIEELTMERWDLVESYLKGEQNAIDWANNYPIEKLVKWGVSE
jgi:hypothetical protein